jgi:hypothetical protein
MDQREHVLIFSAIEEQHLARASRMGTWEVINVKEVCVQYIIYGAETCRKMKRE